MMVLDSPKISYDFKTPHENGSMAFKDSSEFIFVDKPIGPSSHTVLQVIKRTTKCSHLGHHGTLDPFASGLMLVGLHEATKFFCYLNDEKKTYEATIQLGTKTDTLDNTGQIINQADVPPWSQDEICQKIAVLKGDILQVPPMYSAVKVGGQKLHELARKGITLEREPRPVTIHDLQIWGDTLKGTEIKIRATVSRGTYIRVLAEQIAQTLSTYGHLTALRRTMLNDVALSAQRLCEEEQSVLFVCQKSISDMLPFSMITIHETQAKRLLQGKLVVPEELPNIPLQERVQIQCGDVFMGVGQMTEMGLKALRLMSNQFLAQRGVSVSS